MKLEQKLFDSLIENIKSINKIVYDKDARLFLCRDGTKYPSFIENFNSYIMYATVGGNTLPLEHGITTSMIDKSKAMEPPKDCILPCIYPLGIGYHFDKPLEVLAMKTDVEKGIKQKWNIWMLRDIGDLEGYLQDDVACALSRK